MPDGTAKERCMRKLGFFGALLCALWLGMAACPAGGEDAALPRLQITEACADNDFVWTLDFEDYLEIHNPGSQAIRLADYRLRVGRKTAALPDITVGPGAYAVVRCDGKTLPSLSKDGCAVSILDAAGAAVDAVVLPAARNQVWLRETGLSYIPSPGFANTEAGEKAWYASVRGDLILSEALSANFVAVQKNGERHIDALEICNVGKKDVLLSDYYLSDDRKNPAKYHLPAVTLKPGSRYVFYCMEEKDGRHTGFKLSASGETVYLSKGKTAVTDALNIPPLTVDYSYGRKDGATGYFETPTLGGENAALYPRIADRPALSAASSGGHREAFTVTVTGEGPFHYTTDGSEPTRRSAVYNGPVLIEDTTVLRVRAYPKGAARSPAATAVYRFDTDRYTLPTVTVSVDRQYLTDPGVGLMRNPDDRDLEVPATITFLNPDGTLKFSQDCGLSIAGQTSRGLKNRGWKISFRSKYGQDTLHCQVFDDLEADDFDSLVLRLGTTGNAIHDILGTALGKDVCPHVLYQRYRPVNLFIGGVSYGVYYLREHVNANFIVHHLGGDEDHVDMVYCVDEVKEGSGEDWAALMAYCRTHDLRMQEHFDHVAQRLDLESFIDYFIWRPYTGDSDHPNIRYVRSRKGEDRRWRVVIYDMDWAFQSQQVGMNKYTYKLYREKKHNNEVIYALLQNPDFQKMFLERLAYHMKNTFDPDRVTGLMNEIDREVRHDLEMSEKQWPQTVKAWKQALRDIPAFLRGGGDRRTRLLEETKAFFRLTDAEMRAYFGELY